MDRQEARRRQRTVERVRGLVIPAVGIAVFLLGVFAGEPGFWKNALGGLLAAGGLTSVLVPGAFFGWNAPRWWFAESRPEPSRAYLRTDRICGLVALLGSVPFVLFVPG